MKSSLVKLLTYKPPHQARDQISSSNPDSNTISRNPIQLPRSLRPSTAKPKPANEHHSFHAHRKTEHSRWTSYQEDKVKCTTQITQRTRRINSSALLPFHQFHSSTNHETSRWDWKFVYSSQLMSGPVRSEIAACCVICICWLAGWRW